MKTGTPRVVATCARCRARLKVAGSRVTTAHRCTDNPATYMARMTGDWANGLERAARMIDVNDHDHTPLQRREIKRFVARMRSTSRMLRKAAKNR